MALHDEPIDEISDLDRFRTRVHARGLGAHEAALMRVVRPSVRFSLERVAADSLERGVTYFRGRPDVPRDFEWPYFGERPLTFIGQIALAEMAALVSLPLPVDGLLSFFYEAVDQPWGTPGNRGACRVYLTASTVPIERMARPSYDEELDFPPFAEAGEAQELRSCRAVPRVALTLPSVGNRLVTPILGDDVRKWSTTSTTIDSYEALRHSLEQYADLQLCGHPGELAGSVERDADCGANDGRVDTSETYERAARWDALLSVSSLEEELGVMWALSGALYILNPPGSSSRLDFSNAWAVIHGT